MKKALLCIGNELRGDDGVAIEVGKIVQKELTDWKVFFGYDTPEDEFGNLRKFSPDVVIVVDAMSGFKEDGVEFFDLSDDKTYAYSTHNIPTPVLLSYIRKFCKKTLFLGINVQLENVLDFEKKLSKGAKNSTLKALAKIKQFDEILKNS